MIKGQSYYFIKDEESIEPREIKDGVDMIVVY